MSFTFKKNAFRVEIRKQNITQILKQKKKNCFDYFEVNQAIAQYFDQYPRLPLPEICVLNYQLIEENHLLKLINYLVKDKIILDFTKPLSIALLNKIFPSEQGPTLRYFSQVTQLAQKIMFTVLCPQKGAKKKQQDHDSQRFGPKIPGDFLQDLIYLPNCLIQFWGNYFLTTRQGCEISIKEYCIVLKAFIKWFSPKSKKIHIFSKSSICYFLQSFFSSQQIYKLGQNTEPYRQIDDLHINFTIKSIQLIVHLLKSGYFCEGLVKVMITIKDRSNLLQVLIRSLKQSGNSSQFFIMLLDGIENQNILINKDKLISQRFLQLENFTEEQMRHMCKLSIENIITTEVSAVIWKCKTAILEIFNTFLTLNVVSHIFYQVQIEPIVEKLINLYLYCTGMDEITGYAQKTICIIFYNMILLAEAQKNQDQEIQECLIIHDNQRPYFQQRFNKFWISNINCLSQIIQKSEYTFYDHIVELISWLSFQSDFLCIMQVDEEIMNKGKLVMRVCEAYQKNDFNQDQGKKIMASLFQYLERLLDNGFDFSETVNEIMKLKDKKCDMIISEQQEDILIAILRPFE